MADQYAAQKEKAYEATLVHLRNIWNKVRDYAKAKELNAKDTVYYFKLLNQGIDLALRDLPKLMIGLPEGELEKSPSAQGVIELIEGRLVAFKQIVNKPEDYRITTSEQLVVSWIENLTTIVNMIINNYPDVSNLRGWNESGKKTARDPKGTVSFGALIAA